MGDPPPRSFEAVDRNFPEAFTFGVSVHSALELTTDDVDPLETRESKAVGAEYSRLLGEIQAALPDDKKQLTLRLDKTVGRRLCFEELVPLAVAFIAGLRMAGMTQRKASILVKEFLKSLLS